MTVEDERVDLTTVEMMSAFGQTWVWTDVTPEQAQEVYKLLGEPQVTRQLGETGSLSDASHAIVPGEVSIVVTDDPAEAVALLDDTAAGPETEDYTGVEKAVDNQ